MSELDIPETFLWGGVASGLKKSGNPDLSLAYSSYPSTVSAVFTRNSFPAAPVRDARERLESSRQFRGLVVNSGVANAATGDEGLETNRQMIASSAGGLGLEPAEVLGSSTGVIGEPLPVDTIESGIPEAVDSLAEHPGQFAEAIMTTDTHSKIASTSIPSLDANCLGVAKGSGMIRPDMATMLAFIFLDHPVEESFWQSTLVRACGKSFNRISVDGDMSTNDTVMGWSANLPDVSPVTSDDPNAETIEEAVETVCRDLAEQIVRDGEGATKLIKVTVEDAPDDDVALDVAETIGGSSLVKTAFHGEDPNWGRIFSSVGATGHDLDPDTLSIHLNGHCVFDGQPVDVDQDELDQSMQDDSQHVEVNLGSGSGSSEVLTCDLSSEYVRINSEYHT